MFSCHLAISACSGISLSFQVHFTAWGSSYLLLSVSLSIEKYYNLILVFNERICNLFLSILEVFPNKLSLIAIHQPFIMLQSNLHVHPKCMHACTCSVHACTCTICNALHTCGTCTCTCVWLSWPQISHHSPTNPLAYAHTTDILHLFTVKQQLLTNPFECWEFIDGTIPSRTLTLLYLWQIHLLDDMKGWCRPKGKEGM